MTTTISDLVPFVRSEVPAIPESIAIQYIVRGAREFCRKSRSYVQDGILSFIRKQSDYDLLVDIAVEGGTVLGLTDQEIVGVRGIVLNDGKLLVPTTPQQLNSIGIVWRYTDGTIEWYFLQDDNENLSVVRRPTTTDRRTITGVTLSGTDPVVVALSTELISGTTSHHFSLGDIITFYDAAGTTELNGNRYLIAAVTTTSITISLEDGTVTDSSDFTAWTSGGTAHRNSAYIELITQPTISATTLPQQLCQRYSEALISGALMLLFGTPDKPWTNVDLFAYHKANFEQWVDRAMSEAQDRHLKRVPRAVRYGGIGDNTKRNVRYGGYYGGRYGGRYGNR